jgi:hypothetical protein
MKVVYRHHVHTAGKPATYAGVNLGRWLRVRFAWERTRGVGLRVWGRGYRFVFGLYRRRWPWGLVKLGRRTRRFGTTRDF